MGTKKLILLSFLGLLIPAFLSYSNDKKLTVDRVIDGDTIVLSNGEKVRLIGVDTPEKVHPLRPVEFFSEEASKFTKQMVEGKEVRLEFDWQKRDKYGRLLAYVFLLDGTFLNLEIIRQGYGFAYTKFPFKHLDQFKEIEKEARESGRGLWKEAGLAEFGWLNEEKRRPFLVYEMAGKLWAVRYNGFVKLRIHKDDLQRVLSDLRVWVHEFHERDLEEKLLTHGWEKLGKEEFSNE